MLRRMVSPDGISTCHDSGARSGPAGAAASPGLVRLETTSTRDDRITRPTYEERQIADAHRRSLRVYKSISCAGDLLRCMVDGKGRRLSGIFLTLTYRPEIEWRPNQLRGCLNHMRQWCKRRGVKFRVVWVAEQHKSGRVHYHAILFLPKGLTLPKPDKQGWWPYGFTKIERLRKQSVGYLIKYATKGGDVAKPWPKGCRLSGFGGLEREQRIRRAWWVLPKYIRVQCEDWMRVRRALGGGWVSPLTWEWWPAWKPPETDILGMGVSL